jgi:hypothetical protein
MAEDYLPTTKAAKKKRLGDGAGRAALNYRQKPQPAVS